MLKLLLLFAFLDYWWLGRWHVVLFLAGFWVNDWMRYRWSNVVSREIVHRGNTQNEEDDAITEALRWEWADAIRNANNELVRANNDLYRQNFALRNLCVASRLITAGSPSLNAQ